MSGSPGVAQAMDDLLWLHQNGAGAGVESIIAARRRQIESQGYSVAHDRVWHPDGWLGTQAALRAAVGAYMERNDPQKDIAAEELTEAGALAAAEVDRLGG